MARINDLKALIKSLASRGWTTVFEAHGLDLAASDIAVELSKRLRVDRTRVGFEDFCASGTRGVEPGDPAMSLLYHALASPDVHPTEDGAPAASESYPTPAELDLVENYVYSLKPLRTLPDDAVVGVFAFEYRPAASTPHGYHADIVFSRTAIARVGTTADSWFGPWRSFRPDPEGEEGFAVCPSRFGAFVAMPISPKAADPIMGRRDEQNDRLRRFLYPIHKLFPGADCINGLDLDLVFREFHRNDKLRKVHRAGGVPALPGFDLDSLPFVRDSTNGGDLVTLRREGASVLVVPTPGDKMVRIAEQRNAASGKIEPVRFVVPKATRTNRFSTSLDIPPPDDARRAPEYLNIRHPVTKSGGRFKVDDMQSLPADVFQKQLDTGEYEAAHFVDDTADGAVTVLVTGLASTKRTLAAYSLVAAPDFFPLSDQLEITNWVRQSFRNVQEQFAQGNPWPLCEARRAVNIELPRPEATGDRAFPRDDETMTSIVCAKPRSTKVQAPARKRRFASFLPDAAANEFAPGWDVSLARDDEGFYLAAYGLGSPFPEDSKLCAALNSFWPAVAPDASRTFRIARAPTAMPLLDEELGFHPQDPRVLSGEATSMRGWDGEYGPFEEGRDGATWINAASLERSDYVSNALQDRFEIRRTSGIDAQEQILRMEALRSCIQALPPANDKVSTTPLWLVSALQVEDWKSDARKASPKLEGSGYIYVFGLVEDAGNPVDEDPTRLRRKLKTRFVCQISTDRVVFSKDGGSWKTFERDQNAAIS